jgi:putative transposase
VRFTEPAFIQMDERMRFMARLMEGEKMAVRCQEFDISRRTGYKIFNRYRHSGLDDVAGQQR